MHAPAGRQRAILEHLYPEISAGGFSHVDGTVEFYSRVESLLRPGMTIVDYGAGRGEWTRDTVQFRRDLRDLRGTGRTVIGVDIDTAVQENTSVDQTIVCTGLEHIPLPDASVDVIVSDHTFEHLERPDKSALEMDRILKPGGWICARTPNKRGYIAMATNLVPNRRHAAALQTLQPGREEVDVFPTCYRLNTPRALRTHFPTERFQHCTYYWSGEPSYFGQSMPLARVIKLGSRLPDAVQAKLMIFLQKSSVPSR